MNKRVYILLDIVDGRAEQATGVLQAMPGVVMADALEGPPDVIIVMEAAERQQLAKLTIQALASVETMTEHICLLPTRNKSDTATLPKLARRGRASGKMGSSKRSCLCSKVD